MSTTMKVDDVIRLYVKTRDKLTAMKALHTDEQAVLAEQLERMEKWLLAKSEKDGVDSFKTPDGTAYKKKKDSVTVADRTAFFQFAIDNDLMDLIASNANKTNVVQYLADNEELPPGIAYSAKFVINVNRPRSK